MKVTNFTLLLLLWVTFSYAQSGRVLDNLSLPSKLLKSERKFAIYLPPDYATSERSYPVLYLLHGAGDNHTGWVQFGEVLNIADKAIREGTATPMIIVMPDADFRFSLIILKNGDKHFVYGIEKEIWEELESNS